MGEEHMPRESGWKGHRILIQNRKAGTSTGVTEVISFHPEEILLETELGVLSIKGQGLHVSRLNLEKGEVDLDGEVSSLTYGKTRGTKGKFQKDTETSGKESTPWNKWFR